MYASRPRPPLIVYVLRTASGAFERFVISHFPPADAERLFSTPRWALAHVVVRHLSSGLRTVAAHPVVRPYWPAPRALMSRSSLTGRRVTCRPPSRAGRGVEVRRYAA